MNGRRTRALIAMFAVVAAFSATLAGQIANLPDGWIRAGSQPADYEMAMDPTGGRSGGAAFIRSRVAIPSASGFGTIMQQFEGEGYRGKRLRLSAYVKAEGISNWAGLWMRVDGPGTTPLAFDNMQGRPIKGTQTWKRYEIVLDVSTDSRNIAFGLLLAGAGQAWLDDVQFDIVANTVPTTDLIYRQWQTARTPRNLSFDK